MEYALKVTISPTPQKDKFIARVFISAVEGDTTRGTKLVHESDTYYPTPDEDSEVFGWANVMLLLVRAHMADNERWGHDELKVKVLGDLFDPKLF